MGDTIDKKLLPGRALFDTTVLIPALSQQSKAGDPASHLLLVAMLQLKRTVLIAAPSLAEILRREPSNPIPRTPNLIVVAFDQEAAQQLGTKFPPDVLTRVKSECGEPPYQYIKYDAMIAACAMRHRSEVFVTTDDRQRRIAETAGLVVKAPRDFLHKQQDLFGGSTSGR